jgi:hypothetical protein
MTKARTLADNFAADINGITAGTGITGGGTSGTVTITNSMATAIDAKGDLVVGTGADTFSRLAVASTAGYLLSVDSAEATGLKWAAPSAPTAVSCSVYNNGQQTIASGSYSTLTFNSEYFDTDNIHSTSSNTGRLTVPSGLGGKWLVTFAIYLGGATATTFIPKLQVNGSDKNRFNRTTFGSSENTTIVGTQTFNLSAGDYVELLVYQASGDNRVIDTDQYGHFGMSRLGA